MGKELFAGSKRLMYYRHDIHLTKSNEFENNTERINSLLNSLYADDFIADVCLLEIITLWCARKERLELYHINNKRSMQEEELALQGWITIMTDKMYGLEETETMLEIKQEFPDVLEDQHSQVACPIMSLV